MWSPQRYIEQGRAKGVSEEVLNNAVDQIEQVIAAPGSPPPLLTLRQLAYRVDIPYWSIRRFVERAPIAYRHFFIRKISGGRRTISVPHPHLMQVQRWINAHVLSPQEVHHCSFAFKPGSSIVGCAARHTGARWLIKMDVTGFFGSISEIQVFRIFRELSYQPLIAFELARLTTCATDNQQRYKIPRWQNHQTYDAIESYRDCRVGHLPQGAPTSPMLSNLIMRKFDAKIAQAASLVGLTYTRYSDDLTFSTRSDFSRGRATRFIHEVSSLLRSTGLHPNDRKTVVVPPGARKVVLGLLIDGAQPRLPRKFRDNLRQHLHYLAKFGPIEHVKRREFETVLGMKHHIRGLIDFARMVDRPYADARLAQFNAIDWPV